MTKDAALALAKSKGLDLIEISPNAKPPVARIMSFDKYRYQEEKKYKKQRASEKSGGYKQMQIGIKTADNDMLIKAKKVNEFLNAGDKVEIIVVLRGREKAHKDFAKERLKYFLKNFVDPEHKMTAEPRYVMRGISVQISK